MIDSALYCGKVLHQRHRPTQHKFTYHMYMFWLKLSEVDAVDREVSGFSLTKKFSPTRYRREDYLGDHGEPLQDSVKNLMRELGAPSDIDGEVYLLGQVRNFGIYFSPVNFYFLRNEDGHYSHMLAEVSNTPWNKRHCYLVDLATQEDTQKAFHVSPFNPMDMVYKWKITQPDNKLRLALSCFKDTRHFDAAIMMEKKELNSSSLRRVLLSTPNMIVKTVFGIYWQALKLFLKRTPLYSYPSEN